MRADAVFSVGETILLGLDCAAGDFNSVTAIAATIKRARNGEIPPASDPVAGTFTITNRAAAPPIPIGWTLTLLAGLPSAGLFCVDARLTVAGGKIVTSAVFVQIEEAVTS
jgi:hypothetical protein